VKKRILILDIPYAGLGDHLFHSHLPEIAKKDFNYDSVYITNTSKYRHEDYRRLVWEHNPYVDGFTNEKGVSCDIEKILLTVNYNYNLLDRIMQFYQLDNHTRQNEPKIYYKPRYKSEYNFTVYDPNYVSWVGNIDPLDTMSFFKQKNYSFEKIMTLRGSKHLYIPSEYSSFITTETLFDFCDLIHSSKKLYCLTSGTATIASALGKPAIVFFGKEQCIGFQHSKIHEYILIKNNFKSKIKNKIIRFFQKRILIRFNKIIIK
jgi:hypothetical protein